VPEGFILEQFLPFELHADFRELNSEKLNLRSAHSLDQVPEIPFGYSNRS